MYFYRDLYYGKETSSLFKYVLKLSIYELIKSIQSQSIQNEN